MEPSEQQHEDGEQGSKRQKIDTTGMIEHRFLVTNQESSVIIGKKGVNVVKVRQESGAFVSIKNAEPPATERIMTIKGLPESIARAIHVIAQILQQNAKSVSGAPEAGVTIKFIIHKFLAGCILGQGGTIMKEIQSATSARISISEQLPNSTEKAVSIIGTPEAIYAASLRVLEQLQSNPLRSGSISKPYVPGLGAGLGASAFPAAAGFPSSLPVARPPMAALGALGGFAGYGGEEYGFQAGFAAPAPRASPAFGGAVASGEQKTEKIVIPKRCSGAVIGRGGSIISELKMQSGAGISLADADPGSEDRVVSVSGSPQSIQIAIHLIRKRVEDELMRTGGAVATGFA